MVFKNTNCKDNFSLQHWSTNSIYPGAIGGKVWVRLGFKKKKRKSSNPFINCFNNFFDHDWRSLNLNVTQNEDHERSSDHGSSCLLFAAKDLAAPIFTYLRHILERKQLRPSILLEDDHVSLNVIIECIEVQRGEFVEQMYANISPQSIIHLNIWENRVLILWKFSNFHLIFHWPRWILLSGQCCIAGQWSPCEYERGMLYIKD